MATLQVKGLDDRLYEALRARATLENRSISQEVATILRDYLSRPPGDVGAATLAALELAGTWEDERTAEEIVSQLRAARQPGRRFGGVNAILLN